MSGFLAVIALAMQVALAAMFAVGALSKALDRDAFRRAVDGYQLLAPSLVTPVSAAVTAAEGVAAIWLISGWQAFGARMLAFCLLGIFSAAIAINLLRGRRHIDCGCVAGAVRNRIGPGIVIRNGAMMVLLACLPYAHDLDAMMVMNGIGAGLASFALVLAVAALRGSGVSTRALLARKA